MITFLVFPCMSLVLSTSLQAQGLRSLGTYDQRAMTDAARHTAAKKARVVQGSDAARITDALGLGRFYKGGDRWTVAVSRISYGMVRATDGAEARRDWLLDPLFYEFRILDVDPSAYATIEVVRVNADGHAVGDERIRRLLLKVNTRLKVLSKQYFYRDHTKPVISSFEEGSGTGFDPFPVDLPDLDNAKMTLGARVVPGLLPAPLASQLKSEPDPGKTVLFESRDTLGRKVRATWQRGDLWPTLVETRAGFSVLVRQDKI